MASPMSRPLPIRAIPLPSAPRASDRPLTILKSAARGQHIVDAPFINHTDQELALIEALVGRTTPFVFPNDAYRTPRRNY